LMHFYLDKIGVFGTLTVLWEYVEYFLWCCLYPFRVVVCFFISSWSKRQQKSPTTRVNNTHKRKKSPSQNIMTKSFVIILLHYIGYIALLIGLFHHDSSTLYKFHWISFIQTPVYWQFFKMYMWYFYEKNYLQQSNRNELYSSFLLHGNRHWWWFQLIRTLSSVLVYCFNYFNNFKGQSSDWNKQQVLTTCGLDIILMCIILAMQKAYTSEYECVKFTVEWMIPVCFTNSPSTTYCYWTSNDNSSDCLFKCKYMTSKFHVLHVLKDSPITRWCYCIMFLDIAFSIAVYAF
jgi:hypothetical protein